ncbi:MULTISPECIES: uridine kinase [unclassified Ruegeria]|uniref:uridine kinase n=1 Tax=unclassified Ruegeria TaxID=2625375 RepID=UPI0014897FF0|nr:MULTISPECIES: uridine kinase [unclassified Ruegeria]NOD47710.1 uridine kinase [Ruegeria sp. HKCCD5849]NOD52627.1 uridine kinase [Ruegeria sp. HKCCD5851]NOD66046.1 uridine kinase [Ruegeria sp. HKCCD7303]
MIKQDVERVCDLISSRRQVEVRTIVAIAGPPASGKSTLAETVVKSLNTQQNSVVPFATLIPMDGYHLDNGVLEPRGLLPRKGAPETFDGIGFCDAIRRLQSARHELFYPKFDRHMDIAIANAIAVHPETPVVVVEGNYLLMDSDPWRTVADAYAATVFISPTLEELESRLQQRWIKHGFDPKSALRRAKSNDLPNAQLVIRNSRKADLNLNQNYTETGTRYAF